MSANCASQLVHWNNTSKKALIPNDKWCIRKTNLGKSSGIW